MSIGMTTLIETRNFTVIKYRHGTELTDRLTGASTYLQPGDDEMAFLTELEALEEKYQDLHNCLSLVDNLVDPYVSNASVCR
jgi:hypothetical protein